MISLRGILKTLAATAVLVFGAVTTRAAVDPVGPPIGNNRYRSTISSSTDADEFIGRFFAGDILNISLQADRPGKGRSPTLKPVLVLVDPNGLERYAGIVPSADGFGQTAKDLVIDTAGFWGVRVTGDQGTTGSFTIAFRVKPLPKQKFKKLRLGDELPFSRTHEFSGFDGAILNAVLTYTRLSSDVEIRSLQDPSGNEVKAPDGENAVTKAVQKKQRVELKKVVLGKGSGIYRMRVRIPTAAATYNLEVSLTGPPRPIDKSRKIATLSINEPFLDARAIPLAGEPGETVQLTGQNFSMSPPPTVLFGTARSPKVTPGAGGTTLDCVIPPRSGGAVVPMYVINPDRQGAARDNYFAYVPPPKITDFVDATTGLPIRSTSAGAGRKVKLTGSNFETGQTVTVGPVQIAKFVVTGTTEIAFTLPVVPQGTYTITVADVFTRTATTDFTVFFKTPPSFAAEPYTPGAAKVGIPTPVTITGSNFEAADQFLFNGQPTASTLVDSTTRTFVVPALGIGDYSVRLVDSIGTIVDGPLLSVKPPPVITVVTISAGDVVPTNVIPMLGGSTIQLDGTDFLVNDTVTVGGTLVTKIVSNTKTRKTFIAPPGPAGFASITVTDPAGQSGSFANAVRYAGLANTTSSRFPAKSATDDYSSLASVAADLDRDGLADDVVLGSPLGNSPGTRTQLTRILFGNASGTLVDVTATNFPAAFTDPSRIDRWDANTIAIGDLDKLNGNDIVVGGAVSGYSANYKQVRLFKQGTAAGTFTFDSTNSPPIRYSAGVSAYYTIYSYYYGYPQYAVIGPTQQAGVPQSIAIGDIDNDAVSDVIVGTDHFESRQTYYDPTMLTVRYGRNYLTKKIPMNQQDYFPATHVFRNQIPSGLRMTDQTASKLPTAGNSTDKVGQPAALHCRDLALADLNLDGTLDLVIAWDNPTTVTADGLNSKEQGGVPTSPPAVATRVLTYGPKGTSGKFTDVTGSWMPAGTSPEFFHAKRLAFGDLDNDGDQDLVLVLDKGVDAFTGTETHTRRALRILRNDRTKFTDVTGTALPAVNTVTLDDFRGDSLAIKDVDGDGLVDILVSTKSPLKNADDSNIARLRIFFNKGALRFALQYGFSEATSVDTGEADRVLYIGDLGGAGNAVLMLTTESTPAVSPGGAFTRTQEWKK